MTIRKKKPKPTSTVRYHVGRAANRLSRGRLHRHATARMPQLVKRVIHSPTWPERLDGFRILHISDFHLGELLSVDQALAIVAFLGDVEADLVAVTGDIIDFHHHEVEPLLQALADFPSTLGTWSVIGNHDCLVDGARFMERCDECGLRQLVNQSTEIEHDGLHIKVSGIDWARRQRDLDRLVDEVLPESPKEGQASILLAHHPHAFDAAAARGVHLVLSGHTHGGQLNLLHPTPWAPPVGIGAMAHRYPWGVYEKGNSRLHVTAGIGSWFPFRVKCPSEVALLTIRRGWHAPGYRARKSP